MIAKKILKWYDKNARDLPWRVKGRAHPNAYHVWLSEIMLQQTTVSSVQSYFKKFIKIWPDVHALAMAPLEDVLAAWAGLGYYARARNLHQCAKVIVNDYNGRFPETVEELLKLPGIGPYTAAAIAAIAFDQKAGVMDGNIERVLSRVFCLGQKQDIRRKVWELTPDKRGGCYAQGLMDLGAMICTPKRPRCDICPIQKNCAAYLQNKVADYPLKTLKKPKPLRKALVFILSDGTQGVYLRPRPPKGLLGGMLEFPSSPWVNHDVFDLQTALESCPFPVKLKDTGLSIRHTFSHFHLELGLYKGRLKKIPPDNRFNLELASPALPTLMRKVLEKIEAE